MNEDHYRQRARNRLILLAVVIAGSGVGLWLFFHYTSINEFSILSDSIGQFAVTQAEKQFAAPPPLAATGTKGFASGAGVLTIEGVIDDTNVERATATSTPLPPLAENQILDDVALLRLDDMFAKQYFAHVSPTGESALTVASDVNYAYLALGENLALGNFAGDQDVVNAWMASEGHRENILSRQYTEIGVAVRKGVYEGQSTWIAVQVFGRPASDCPEPDPALKVTIDNGEAQLNQMASTLAEQNAAINAEQPKYGEDYNDKVAAYNALATQYNAFGAQLKQEVAQYNDEVEAFNVCLDGVSP
ncbi:MAG TPA: CAP domain-containing protein [Candidatus Paceibacterota bacterium]|nr:CAP domain-containing protein [Candidatus Paceibacterota bacterium]